MAFTVASLFNQLTPDHWRKEVGFSEDIDTANQALFRSSTTQEAEAVLIEWLQKNQPCLFGRIAAKFGFITYCILQESDLLLRDELIQEKIQDARLHWIKDGYEGRKSNFIILVVSPTISYALPDQAVAALAQRLCSLYLQTEAKFDFVHHDHIFLEKPGHSRATWRWLAGVNYFSAHADKRWWHDHRIPGGMGFSTNSVGHLVKSEKIAHAMRNLNQELAMENEEGWTESKVDSLEKALLLAMRTISLASQTVSGRATELLDVQESIEADPTPKCPVKLPEPLSTKNHCQYRSYYHTDYTLPSEYFVADVSRPEGVEPYILDFTYLFYKDVKNPDHHTMGEGQRIRDDQSRTRKSEVAEEDYKVLRGQPESIPIDTCEILLRALSV